MQLEPGLKRVRVYFFEEIMKQIIQNTIVTFLVAGSALPALAQAQKALVKNITSGAFLAPKAAPTLSQNISAAVQRTVAKAQVSAAMQTPALAPTFLSLIHI